MNVNNTNIHFEQAYWKMFSTEDRRDNNNNETHQNILQKKMLIKLATKIN